MDRDIELMMIDSEMARFPKEFGLRAYPGKRFTISKRDSYVTGKTIVMLYVHVKSEPLGMTTVWKAFAKGTPAELLQEVTA